MNEKLKEPSKNLDFAALLVTGGVSHEDDDQHSAEVILPWGQRCSLPPLPSSGRYLHTQSGLTVCGGQETPKDCSAFKDGKWEQSHELGAEREQHVSWQSQWGTFLLGGDGDSSTTYELLSDNSGDSSSVFNLLDTARY